MADLSADLIGLPRFEATTDRAGRQLADMTPAHEAAGHVLVPRARQLTPRVSGTLGAGNRAVANGIGVELVNDVIYAGPIYFGWPAHGIAPHPWGDQAAVDVKPATDQIYQNYLDHVVDGIEGTR